MPKLIKVLVMSIAVVLVSPLLVLACLERLTSSERLFVSMSQALSMIPNLPGQYLRAAFYALIYRIFHGNLMWVLVRFLAIVMSRWVNMFH